MPFSSIIYKPAFASLFAFLLIMLTPAPAFARSHVNIGIGVGFPIYSGIGYGHVGYYHRQHYWPRGRSYYRPYYRSYYAPVIVAPPPIIYAPPPVYSAPIYDYDAPVQATPTSNVYRAPNGQYCREYQATARVGSNLQNVYGTACQDANGTWRIIN